MKVEWKCPECKRVHYGDSNLVMKVCCVCQVKMETVEYG